ncbi:uncharacterized protein [Epargyreus clarus]|uniref:uncharacterized protein n=1 Tax=Epargyreus clarus TaxID=520877 RepID=UPI003C2F87E4
MRPMSRKYYLFVLILIALIDITYSSDHETSTEGRRQSRVSGRIVKLYSGPKPDPILCLGEGFQADAADCSVFYRCLKASNGKYTVYRFQCGPGTIYDPETEICNYPRSTKRSECRGFGNDKLISSTEGYMENEIDELQENKELPSPISTKAPELTNTISSTIASWKPDKLESSYITTSYPWFTPSNNVYGETTSSQSNIPVSISSKKPTDYTTSSYFTRKPSSLSDNLCTSDGFMGDNIDCRKFYRCVNNQRGGFLRYEFSCSETTVWDEDTQGCNHPWAVQRRRCGKGTTYDENSISHINQFESNKIILNKPVQQQTQISYGSEVTQSQIQISTGPVTQNQTQINYGDRINQEKKEIKQNQTQISNGSAVSQSQTQINYGDKVTQTQVQIDHSYQSSQTQTQVAQFSSTVATTSTQYHIKDNYSNKCTNDGFMGDPNDCKKFYRCTSNGRGGFDRHEFSCGEGTLWDKNLEACNHDWAVKDCGEKHNIQNSPSMNPQYTTTSSFNNEIEDEIGYGNQNNVPEIEKLTQSPSTLAISTLTTTTTESLKLSETDCKSSGFFGNANDCAKFYRCVQSGEGRFTKYEYKCGDGTVWDPEIESCNHAWAVKHCGSGLQKEITSIPTSTENKIITTVSLIQTTTQKYVNDVDYDSGYGSVQRETPPHSTSTTERISYEGTECKTSGFMGDSNDCKKFYRCVDNSHGNYTRYEFSCGEGTVWDPEIEACNHASDVDKCGGSAVNNNINKVTTTHPVYNYNSESDNSYVTPNNEAPESSQQTTTRTTTTKSVSAVSNTGNECQSNGFMGDDNDCRIFYRCVENGNGGFIRYEFSCGDGTVWDSRISACNHAWAVEKCGGSMTSNENLNPSTQGPHPTTTSIQSESTTKTSQHTPSSSSTTSTMPDVNNQCVVNGFMGNKNDCKKFYRCVDDGKGSFTRYEFTCGEGTVWDPKIEACNYAWAVESCGGNASPVTETSSTHNLATEKDEEIDNNYGNQNNQELSSSTVKTSTVTDENKQCQTEGFMGDSNDCKKFYRCVNDGKGSFIRYEFSCGEGTVWDSEINACNHVGSVKTPCSSMPASISTESSQDYTSPASQTNPTSQSSPASVNNDYSTTTKPQRSQRCEQEGFIGDDEDCKKFYRCTDNGQGGFHKYEFTCGEGTVWDQEILACNHASSSRNCSSIHSESQAETTHTSAPPSSTSSVTQSTEKTVTSSSNDECVSEGFYANTNDCKKFFRCVGNGKGGFTKYDFTCGDGTIWVQEIQACDHDLDNSHCSKNIGTSTTQPNKEETIVSSSTSTSSTSTTDKSTPAKPNDEYGGQSSTNKPVSTNENICEAEGFYPNNNDCRQFYQCVNNGNGGYNKFDFTCGEGTAWDVNIQSCNHISEVTSCQNQGGIQAKPTVQDEAVSESSSTTEAYSTGSTTTTKASNQDSCEESGYYGNSEDCKKFYRCVDNGKGGFTKYDFTCGDGTIWDQDITACNHPQDVTNPSCKNKENTSTTSSTTSTAESSGSSESTTKSTSSTDSPTQSTTAENNVSQSTEETATKKPNNNYTCTEAGFYADPYDCKKFYRCVDWGGDGKTFSIYHFDCGEGTIWDPALQTCNHEDSVYPPRDCSEAQSQTENNNETMTTEGTTSKQEETTESSTTDKTTTTTTQSTTQSSTTTESSSTEQSSTTDQTSSTQQSTTQQPTTEQTTTQQSTTEKSTTQQSTTEQTTTTQQSTTEKSTTQQSTTEQSTTQQSTTEQSTTQQSTTEQSTTQQSRTEQSTTQQSTTEQSTTTQSSTESTSTTTEQTTPASTEETTTTTAQSTTSESTTTTAEQTTKAEQTTTQESSTEQTSENQSSTTEQSSTTQETTDRTSTTEGGQDTTTEKGSSEKECPETDDDQYLYVCPTGFRRHPKYCNLFYQCTEDDESHEVKVATFTCPNNTIYDESKIQCVEEEKADKKCEGQIAQKRRVKRLDANYKEPITVSRDNYSCPKVGHFPFEKNEECSPVLFKCEVTKTGKLRGFVYQCPEGYVYWSISRKCEPITAMTDCKRSYIIWNSRYEIPVERKNVARKK